MAKLIGWTVLKRPAASRHRPLQSFYQPSAQDPEIGLPPQTALPAGPRLLALKRQHHGKFFDVKSASWEHVRQGKCQLFPCLLLSFAFRVPESRAWQDPMWVIQNLGKFATCWCVFLSEKLSSLLRWTVLNENRRRGGHIIAMT